MSHTSLLYLPRPILAALGWGTILLLSLAILGCGEVEETPEPPSTKRPIPIIILDIDTLRADHLGTYGYERDTSPHMDSLAGESVVFEWAFSQAPNTPPSQSSIFTGLYPSAHGFIDGEGRLPEEARTLAEVLSEGGYTTAAFVDGGYLSPVFGLNQGFGVYRDFARGGLEKIGPSALDWMRQHAEETFLLVIHTYDVHTPYTPPQPYASMFMPRGLDVTPGFDGTAAQISEARRRGWRNLPPLPPDDLAFAIARYDGGIRYVDDWVGRFLEVYHSSGLAERAVLVILSDHGEEFQEHMSLSHERLYSTVTRIPLIIRLPGGRGARRVKTAVQTVDLMPTLLDIANVEPPAGLQGRSLGPAMGNGVLEAQPAFAESPFFGGQLAVTLPQFRFLTNQEGTRTELYRYRQDPMEQDNLATDHPDVLDRSRAALKRWQETVSSPVADSVTDPELSQETLDELRALGYLQ